MWFGITQSRGHGAAWHDHGFQRLALRANYRAGGRIGSGGGDVKLKVKASKKPAVIRVDVPVDERKK